MVIRRAAPDDVAALVALHLDTVLVAYRDWLPRDAPTPDREVLARLWSTDLAEAHAVHVAERDGSIVGSVVARANGDLARLHVHPDHWGAGIGQALHDVAVEALRATGNDRAELWVIEANARARSLYERNGWQVDPARVLDHLGVREVRYVLDLTNVSA